jgi:signal transduction histidine kinase
MQEAANNAVRHGRARRLQFRLQADGEVFEISLGNDGLQLDREQLANPAGIGVAGMRLRADLLGGTLAIEPRPGGGAEVTLRLPGMAGRRAEDGGIHE